jgi:hypothetical protein
MVSDLGEHHTCQYPLVTSGDPDFVSFSCLAVSNPCPATALGGPRGTPKILDAAWRFVSVGWSVGPVQRAYAVVVAPRDHRWQEALLHP